MIHGRQVMQGVAPSKEEACEACVTAASQTNTWTNYCQCFVTNSNKCHGTRSWLAYEGFCK